MNFLGLLNFWILKSLPTWQQDVVATSSQRLSVRLGGTSPRSLSRSLHDILLEHGVVVMTTAKLHSSKPELRFCAGSNPARDVSEIRDGEDLWQWSQLEIRLCLSSVNHTTKTIHHHHHHHNVWRGRNVPSVRLFDVSNKSQMKHPTTSQWYVTKTSQWYVSLTSH